VSFGEHASWKLLFHVFKFGLLCSLPSDEGMSAADTRTLEELFICKGIDALHP